MTRSQHYASFVKKFWARRYVDLKRNLFILFTYILNKNMDRGKEHTKVASKSKGSSCTTTKLNKGKMETSNQKG